MGKDHQYHRSGCLKQLIPCTIMGMRDSGVPATRFPVRTVAAGGNGPVQLDEMSKAIIEKLQQDGRRSYAAIGKSVGLSEAAVRQLGVASSADTFVPASSAAGACLTTQVAFVLKSNSLSALPVNISSDRQE